ANPVVSCLGNSATSSASGSNSNLSASTSASASAAASPTSSVNVVAGLASCGKAPPGMNNSNPITVRFNANEESLDDILQSFHHSKHSPSGGASGGGDASPTSAAHNLLGMKNNGLGLGGGMIVGNACDSLSSSPSQPQMQAAASLFGNDEVNLRNNFLQGGGFFNRKRSGSIEGASPTTGGPGLISALSGVGAASAVGGGTATGSGSGTGSGSSGGGPGSAGDGSSSGGTWRLIKGKVTQTIEEIKSSKHPLPAIPIIVADPPSTACSNDPDSDTECVTVNTSISEELPLDQEHKQNSDSDAEAELLQLDSNSLGSGDLTLPVAGSTERSRLRRGLAHIRSKVKAKNQAAAMNKKDLSPGRAPGTVRSGFLRRRHVVDAASEAATSQQADIPIASGSTKKRGILLARKDVEIESGVEMLEDMLPPSSVLAPVIKDSGLKEFRSPDVLDCGESEIITPPLGSDYGSLETCGSPPHQSQMKGSRIQQTVRDSLSKLSVNRWRKHQSASSIVFSAIFCGFLVVLLILPLHDFLRGIFATVLFFTLVDLFWSHLWEYLGDRFMLAHPERVAFAIPNFDDMPICEIPAVEEHKTIKTYAGWMNEMSSYDPNTFSFSQTRSVYVRLDGCILKMSGTNARIPKRRMWNEPPIDRTKVLFTDHRSYDLRDCRIELLPLGLARKRFFNRKYPIQLIIKNVRECLDDALSTSVPSDDVIATENKDIKSGCSGAAAAASTPPEAEDPEKQMDFGAAVMQANLEQLRDATNPDKELDEYTMPCGDEVRLLLFSRCDREKEDWYRRFLAASKGFVHERELRVPMARFVEDTDLQTAAARQAVLLVCGKVPNKEERTDDIPTVTSTEDADLTPDGQFENITDEDLLDTPKEEDIDGMIMSANVSRNQPDYVRFMANYQKACNQSRIPVTRNAFESRSSEERHRKTRRAKRHEDELWKGIDQTLFLGPSGSIVWANVIIGRFFYSWLHNEYLHERLKDILQKKLNAIKLPSFMEEVVITNIYLGNAPVLCHRVSQPMLDERGVWVDADITYEGLSYITLTTKLNLLRVRSKAKGSAVPETTSNTTVASDLHSHVRSTEVSDSVIFDSDAESSGGSSTETESPTPGGSQEPPAGTELFQNSPGNARRIFKIVDRIAASNLFQYATELPYVQRAMENMNANIKLRVDLKGLVARGTLNIPPPPSDRVWASFRGPPRLWISTKPQVGDKSVDWSIVTNVIENKLCEAVNKFLVYPNMVDFSIPFLSYPNFEDDPTGAPN
ncbi:hypothetical protein KR018_009218, partial [Drosophila ironensis]